MPLMTVEPSRINLRIKTHCWPFNLLTFPDDVSSMSHQISSQSIHVALIDAEDQTGLEGAAAVDLDYGAGGCFYT